MTSRLTDERLAYLIHIYEVGLNAADADGTAFADSLAFLRELAARRAAESADAALGRAIREMARIRLVGTGGNNYMCAEFWREHADRGHGDWFYKWLGVDVARQAGGE